ncbi:hypothetical protein [Bacillus bombysepticus]|uniref:hypothetical protein n=1 Tax=Bacillus bombysepticus TaxID=658666 RepID=UPI00301B325D
MRPENDVAELAKQLRKKLKDVLGKEIVKKHSISVRSKRYSMGTSINVSAVDMSKDYLLALSKEFERLRRDPKTSDVGKGGNVFLEVTITYSDDFMNSFKKTLNEKLLNEPSGAEYLAERETFAKIHCIENNPNFDFSKLEIDTPTSSLENKEENEESAELENAVQTEEKKEPKLYFKDNVIDATELFRRVRQVKE